MKSLLIVLRINNKLINSILMILSLNLTIIIVPLSLIFLNIKKPKYGTRIKIIDMKNFILNIWNFILKPFNKSKKLESDNSHFHSLSPTDRIKDGQHYFNVLSWALASRKKENIKNIALTGPYGSGKSSILQSFQKINTNKDLHFLNISLATFKEEEKKEEEKGKKKRQTRGRKFATSN